MILTKKNYIILATSSSFACRFAVAKDWGAWLKLLICLCSNCQFVRWCSDYY